jgi:hypothetical protein
MEYMILTLPPTTKAEEKLINEYAEQGWIVICTLADYRLILGRNTVEIK